MEFVNRLRQYVWLFVLWFVVIGIGVIGAFWEYYQEKNTPPTVVNTREIVVAPEESTITLDAIATPPAHTARSVWLYDRESQSVLYEENAHEATSVASLAKLMTAIVAYENYALDEPVPIASAAAAIGNRAKFLPRDIFSVYDLLHALLIFSANDSAEALARHYPGGMDAFTTAMNERANELKLNTTHFQNPSGLDHSDQYSSAADLGKLTNTFLEIPLLAEIVSQPVKQVRELVTGRIDTIYTTNALLYRNPQYRGLKTGTTELAGESLIFRYVSPERENPLENQTTENLNTPVREYDLIFVLLGSENRFADAEALTLWATTALELQNIQGF